MASDASQNPFPGAGSAPEPPPPPSWASQPTAAAQTPPPPEPSGALPADPHRRECDEGLLPVTKVLVMEDRAHVVRRGIVELAAGESTLRIVGVSPLAVDKTLRVRFVDPAAGGSVLSSRLMRAPRISVAEGRPELAALVERIEDLKRERARRRDAQSWIKADLHRRQVVKGHFWREIQDDVSVGLEDVGGWGEGLDELDGQIEEFVRQTAEADAELARVEEELKAASRKLRRERDRASELLGVLHLETACTAAGRFELEIEYVVPCACWRPLHRASLVGEGEGTLRWEAGGCVWQATGEDWNDVALSFSTHRPTAAAAPPPLVADELIARRRTGPVVVETREREVQAATEAPKQGGGGTRTPEEMPGIDDGGARFHLPARERVTIPGDGRPHPASMFVWEGPAERSTLLLPELSDAAYVVTKQVNGSLHPLLAGPVLLSRGMGLVGRTHTGFVAPGEPFELTWGGDGEVRSQRDELADKPKASITGWQSVRHERTIRVRNLGGQAKAFTLRERLPVSEIPQVKIVPETEATSEGVQPDANGFLHWRLVLQPWSDRTIRIVWQVQQGRDVTTA